MSKKLLSIVVLLIAATSLFGSEPPQRTIIVRDGNILFDDGLLAGKRPFLGVSLTELTPELREFFGAAKDAGVLVSSVTENGPAAKAGVRAGDVIIALNGTPVTDYRDLRGAMKGKHAGDSIRLEVVRGKARQTMVATAEERQMPEIRSFNLRGLERELGKPLIGSEWHGRLIAPETEELRTRIRDLEKRLQELEKKLQK